MNSGRRKLLKTRLWISFDFFQKTKKRDSSAGAAYLRVFTVTEIFKQPIKII